MVGKSLSHYKILEELGRGGMGIVYKAQDTKLDRTVAIKVLPSAALASEDDRARFYREAKAAAQLHHPHIASVFEIDEAVPEGSKDDDLRPFISMEFIEGETLHDRIQEGPLKLEEAIRIASQIASGLEAAHEKNIVHRDLKGQNVMLTAKGEAKILDFGLAQTASSTKLTRLGSTLGTVAYMSPEQARGEEVDRRTDLWSLGVVLYEMIAGKSPFPGDYEQAIVYEILNTDPEPLTAVRTGVPMQLEWLIAKLLAKVPEGRYQSATEVNVDLLAIDTRTITRSSGSSVSASPTTAHEPLAASSGARGGARISVAIAALVVGTIVGIVLGRQFFSTDSPDILPPVVRTNLLLPDNEPLAFIGAAPLYLGRTALAISDDGSVLAYVAELATGTTSLVVRRLDTFESSTVPNTEGAYHPFFSPDGTQLGFFTGDELKLVSLAGGPATSLADVRNPTGAVWTQAGEIIVSDSEGNQLRSVSVSTGEMVSLGTSGRNPSRLPDSEYVLVTQNEGEVRDAAIVEIATGHVEMLGLGSRQGPVVSPTYIPSGHIVYLQNAQLVAVPFDAPTQTIVGTPVSVIQSVRDEAISYGGQYAISNTGTLVYASGGNVDFGTLTAVNSNGDETELLFEPQFYGEMRLSPDGSKLAILVLGTSWDIWIYDLVRMSEPERLTFEGINSNPVWDQSGSRIYFESIRNDSSDIYSTSISSTGNEKKVTNAGVRKYPSDISGDGKWLLFSKRGSESLLDIMALSLMGDSITQSVAETQFSEYGGRLSPDGKFMAFRSDEAGTYEVYLKEFSSDPNRTRLSTSGGMDPLWSRDGTSVYYNLVRDIYRVDVYPDSGFRRDPPILLFSGNYLDLAGVGWAYDETRDRFILAKSVEQETKTTSLNVVSNWFEELKRIAAPSD